MLILCETECITPILVKGIAVFHQSPLDQMHQFKALVLYLFWRIRNLLRIQENDCYSPVKKEQFP